MGEELKTAVSDFSNWSCPLPLADYPTIVMGHGGGGKLGNELVEHLFLPAFRNPALENLGDAAVLELGGGRLAMSTDSFVVQPLFFPGGAAADLKPPLVEPNHPHLSIRRQCEPWPSTARATTSCRPPSRRRTCTSCD